MFDIGFWELSLIMLLALLVLGPERLPGVVSTLGNWAGRARFMARSLRMQVERELAREVAESKKSPGSAAKPGVGQSGAGPEPEKSDVRRAAEAAQAAQEEALTAARAGRREANQPAGEQGDDGSRAD
jgi:sec-independent protein translocase protein TatB